MAVAKYELTEQAQKIVDELTEINKLQRTSEADKEANRHEIWLAQTFGKKRDVGEGVNWENNFYEKMLNERLRATPNLDAEGTIATTGYLDVIARLERMNEQEGVTEDEKKKNESKINLYRYVNEVLPNSQQKNGRR